MSFLERRIAWCAWCKKSLGFSRKDYCSPACKQKHYRYRKRGHREARPYGVKDTPPA